jgi:cold shock protein
LGSAFRAAFLRDRLTVSSEPIDVRYAAHPRGVLKYYLELLLMATGTVKWFNAQKGYGFIQPETGGKDVFVHISAVERAGIDDLREGQKLSYELEQGQRGRVSAVNLRLA